MSSNAPRYARGRRRRGRGLGTNCDLIFRVQKAIMLVVIDPRLVMKEKTPRNALVAPLTFLSTLPNRCKSPRDTFRNFALSI